MFGFERLTACRRASSLPTRAVLSRWSSFFAQWPEVPPVKRVLEINPRHQVIRALEYRLSKGEGKETLGEYVFLIHDQCLLAEGGRIEEPALFARRVTEILAKSLKGNDETVER